MLCDFASTEGHFPLIFHLVPTGAGSALLLLGDRPSAVTARRMGDSIFRGAAPLFGGACAASLAADVAAATGSLPGLSGLLQ
jgi:hypothetical protein